MIFITAPSEESILRILSLVSLLVAFTESHCSSRPSREALRLCSLIMTGENKATLIEYYTEPTIRPVVTSSIMVLKSSCVDLSTTSRSAAL